MKKFVFMMMSLLLGASAFAQVESYTYHRFSTDGCRIECFVASNNGKMMLTIDAGADEGLTFSDNPTLLIRFFDGAVLKIDGRNLGIARTITSSSTTVYSATNMASSSSTTNGFARSCYEISPEDAAHFNSGVAKIRLSTVPFTHEREFKKDAFGIVLYQEYLRLKKAEENF